MFQADDLQEAAKGILIRAAERGVITGVPELPMQKKKRRKRDKRIAEVGDEVTARTRAIPRDSLFKIEEDFLLEAEEEQATNDEVKTINSRLISELKIRNQMKIALSRQALEIGLTKDSSSMTSLKSMTQDMEEMNIVEGQENEPAEGEMEAAVFSQTPASEKGSKTRLNRRASKAALKRISNRTHPSKKGTTTTKVSAGYDVTTDESNATVNGGATKAETDSKTAN